MQPCTSNSGCAQEQNSSEAEEAAQKDEEEFIRIARWSAPLTVGKAIRACPEEHHPKDEGGYSEEPDEYFGKDGHLGASTRSGGGVLDLVGHGHSPHQWVGQGRR